MQEIADALGISVLALDALIILLLGQAALQIYCLWNLARHPLTPRERARRWALIVIFGGVIGSLVYLVTFHGDERGHRSGRTAGDLLHRRRHPNGNDPA